MAESIFAAVREQIKQNVSDTLNAFGDGQADWGELAVHALSQLLISALYLGLFLVVYALLISIVRFAVGKKRAQHPLFNHARTGIRYLFGLGAFLVIMAQFGAAPELLKSMARAGLMGLGGAGRMQPVWVEDVARCFVDAVTNERARGEIYPIGGPDRYTWPQLYRAIKSHLPGARNKPIVAIPVWKAKILAALPGTPFNRDQVIMSQEDSICDTVKVEADFGVVLASFEEKLAEYAGRIE